MASKEFFEDGVQRSTTSYDPWGRKAMRCLDSDDGIKLGNVYRDCKHLGAQINAKVDIHGYGGYMWCSNYYNNMGDTALHLAIKFKKIRSVCVLLLVDGVKFDVANEDGETPAVLSKRVFGLPLQEVQYDARRILSQLYSSHDLMRIPNGSYLRGAHKDSWNLLTSGRCLYNPATDPNRPEKRSPNEKRFGDAVPGPESPYDSATSSPRSETEKELDPSVSSFQQRIALLEELVCGDYSAKKSMRLGSSPVKSRHAYPGPYTYTDANNTESLKNMTRLLRKQNVMKRAKASQLRGLGSAGGMGESPRGSSFSPPRSANSRAPSKAFIQGRNASSYSVADTTSQALAPTIDDGVWPFDALYNSKAVTTEKENEQSAGGEKAAVDEALGKAPRLAGVKYLKWFNQDTMMKVAKEEQQRVAGIETNKAKIKSQQASLAASVQPSNTHSPRSSQFVSRPGTREYNERVVSPSILSPSTLKKSVSSHVGGLGSIKETKTHSPPSAHMHEAGMNTAMNKGFASDITEVSIRTNLRFIRFGMKEMEQLAHDLKYDSIVRTLCLPCVHLTTKLLSPLLHSIPTMSALSYLDLSQNPIDDDGAYILASILCNELDGDQSERSGKSMGSRISDSLTFPSRQNVSKGTSRVSIGQSKNGGHTHNPMSLHTLVLAGTRITDAGGEALVTSWLTSPECTLQRLSLLNTYISDEKKDYLLARVAEENRNSASNSSQIPSISSESMKDARVYREKTLLI